MVGAGIVGVVQFTLTPHLVVQAEEADIVAIPEAEEHQVKETPAVLAHLIVRMQLAVEAEQALQVQIKAETQ